MDRQSSTALPMDWPSRAAAYTANPLSVAQMFLIPQGRLRTLSPDSLGYGGLLMTAADILVVSACFSPDAVSDRLLSDMLPRASTLVKDHTASIRGSDVNVLAVLLLADLGSALARPVDFDPMPLFGELTRQGYFITDGRRQTVSACLGHRRLEAAVNLLADDQREIVEEVKTAQVSILEALRAGDGAAAEAAFMPLLRDFFRLQADDGALAWADLLWLSLAIYGGPTSLALAALRRQIQSLVRPGP